MTNEKKDLNLIVKTTSAVGSTQIVQLVLKYVFTLLAVRLLGAVYYGQYVISQTVIQIVSLVSLFGLDRGLIKQVAHHRSLGQNKEAEQSIIFGFRISILSGLVFAAGLYLSSSFLAEDIFRDPSLDILFRLIALSIPFLNLVNMYYATFQASKNVTRRAINEFVILPVTLIIYLILFHFFIRSAIALILSFVASYITAFFLAFFQSEKVRIIKKTTINKEVKREYINFSLPVLLSSSLNYVRSSTDTLLLGILSTSASVGIYAVASRLGTFVALPLLAFNMIFSPMISEIYAKNDIERLRKNYHSITKLILIISLPVFAILTLFAVPILNIFGKEFTDASIVLIIICAGQLINTSVGLSGQIIMMTGNQMITLYNSILLIVLSVVLNILLIPKLGIIGAAVSNAACVSIINVIELFQIKKYIGIHPYSRSFFKPILAVAGAALTTYILKMFIEVNILASLLLVIFFVSIYILFLWKLKLEEEEKMILYKIKNKLLSI